MGPKNGIKRGSVLRVSSPSKLISPPPPGYTTRNFFPKMANRSHFWSCDSASDRTPESQAG